ncbi:MAG: hypothetical protein JWP01_1277 [Myxococcales bacterium]|nr:hypothetical protein [Myxococcales bacterium]
MTHRPSPFTALDADALAITLGGAAAAPGQAELRELAKSYCPATYDTFKTAKTITRGMGERCLDEAGYGMFKGQLDHYFPTK